MSWYLNQRRRVGGVDGLGMNQDKDTLASVIPQRDLIKRIKAILTMQLVEYMTKTLNKWLNCKEDSHLLKLLDNMLLREGITIRHILGGKETARDRLSRWLCKKCIQKIYTTTTKTETLAGKRMSRAES